MKVELTPEVQANLQQLVDSGQFPSIEAAVNYGASLLHGELAGRDRKLADLRATLSASIAKGGRVTGEQLDQTLAATSAELKAQGY